MINKKILVGIIGVAIVLAIAYLIMGNSPTVSAQGSGTLKVQPDLTSVVIGIEGKDFSASVAQKESKDIGDKVLASLLAAGIAEKDISVGSYSSYPDYDYSSGSNVLKGYIVRQELVVKVQDYSEVGKVIDASIAGGGIVSYINAELSPEKQSSYKTQVLKMASEDARVKAEATASGLGKKLGSLVSVKSQDFYYPGPMPYYAKAEGSSPDTAAMDARQAASNLSPQDLEVTASVVVEYKLRSF